MYLVERKHANDLRWAAVTSFAPAQPACEYAKNQSLADLVSFLRVSWMATDEALFMYHGGRLVWSKS